LKLKELLGDLTPLLLSGGDSKKNQVSLPKEFFI